MPMKRIILNADDYGKRKETNQAINDAFKQGLICSAGLIVTGKYLADAVEYINEGDYWDRIHIHLNLSRNVRFVDPEDKPLSEKIKKDTLFCKDGMFSKYKGLPDRFLYIYKWRKVYDEIAAQYEYFQKISNGKGNFNHVDFHLWYNLTWPVAVALRFFTRKYKIKSVRYIGVHQEQKLKYRILKHISHYHKVKSYRSTNIDYYLTDKHIFDNDDIFEIYCHPDYINGIFIDNSTSYFKHKQKPLKEHIQLLKNCENVCFIPWKDV